MCLIRAGKNPQVPSDRNIYLCQIGEANHVVCIKDLQKFARSIRLGSYSSKRLETHTFCDRCLRHIINDKFEHHHEMCCSLKPTYKTVMPVKGVNDVYRFKDYNATEKALYSCYLDTEAVLIPVSDKKKCHS